LLPLASQLHKHCTLRAFDHSPYGSDPSQDGAPCFHGIRTTSPALQRLHLRGQPVEAVVMQQYCTENLGIGVKLPTKRYFRNQEPPPRGSRDGGRHRPPRRCGGLSARRDPRQSRRQSRAVTPLHPNHRCSPHAWQIQIPQGQQQITAFDSQKGYSCSHHAFLPSRSALSARRSPSGP